MPLTWPTSKMWLIMLSRLHRIASSGCKTASKVQETADCRQGSDSLLQPIGLYMGASRAAMYCCIAELTQRVASAEAAAVYDDARAQHEQHMREINGAIAGVQQEVQKLNSDVR